MSNEIAKCTSKLECMKGKAVKIGSQAAFKLKQYSPEILTVAGVSGLIFATYKFATAKSKAEEILDQHNYKMDAIARVDEISDEEDYTEMDRKQDTILTYAQTGKDFLVLYGPIVALGVGSIVAIFGGQKILRKRNVALVAAYKVLDRAFTEYRARVFEELGADQDFHFRYGTEYKTITEEIEDENGKTKKQKRKVQVLTDGDPSMYARLYSKQVFDTENGGYVGSSQWSPHPDYNAHNLVIKNAWANQHLQAHGYLFLNDVYEALGFPKTKAGQVVGWIWDGQGDNYVSFGPEVDALLDKTAGHLFYEGGAEFLLDFNVDGPILDKFELAE